MSRRTPNSFQNFLSSVILPLLSIPLLPISFAAVFFCILRARIWPEKITNKETGRRSSKGCVMISGGRMSKGLTLCRAFKRAGWKVIGVEEEGWGELCPMKFSLAVDYFFLLPPSSKSYESYSKRLLSIAKKENVTLFIPVSGAGSSIEDSKAADEMFKETKGKCKTFIQDPETMEDLHDKDKFMSLVKKLGMKIPDGKMVMNVDDAIDFLSESGLVDGGGLEPKFILKCMGLDENRGDMTLFPLKGDDEKLSKTKKRLESLKLKISKECPYVFQEFIPGQEYCTHASVINGKITSFVCAPSNDMLMTYENLTSSPVGQAAEKWTKELINKMKDDLTPSGEIRRLTGHFSFDLIKSTRDGNLYPIECNARVHTAIILLPLSEIASCYDDETKTDDKQTSELKMKMKILKPINGIYPRSWIYNDLIMRYLPRLLPIHSLMDFLHPSLLACIPDKRKEGGKLPKEDLLKFRVDPTLAADDWVPFIILWHVYWPYLLLSRWFEGKKWTRLNASTGRIFEA